MRVNPISQNYFPHFNNITNNRSSQTEQRENANNLSNVYYMPVNFTAKKQEPKRVQDIDYFEYKALTETQKKILRKKCLNYNKEIDLSELRDKSKAYLPLMDDRIMEQFLAVCEMYVGLKDEPILCLGRSPKWFLNTALWMKGGLDNYKFVPFSKFWYLKNPYFHRVDSMAPTQEEKKKYKKYLKDIKADPKHIVDVCKKTGKKVIITDYISSGKGICSFLDVMSEFAEQDGILEEFANSIRIVGIGSMEYQEKFYHGDEDVNTPKALFPDRLLKYYFKIPQEYHDMPYEVFEQMLINENTNECRSSFYPHEAWTAYKPGQFRTGMISDKKIEELKSKHLKKVVDNFSPAMRDYRNLLNFRILDYLDRHGKLRENLNSKQWD